MKFTWMWHLGLWMEQVKGLREMFAYMESSLSSSPAALSLPPPLPPNSAALLGILPWSSYLSLGSVRLPLPLDLLL